MTIKYAIVGAGTMGREHIRNIKIIDEAEVVALSDTNSESVNESLTLLKKDIPAFNNHHDLINANQLMLILWQRPILLILKF